MAALDAAAYGGAKDASAAWGAEVLSFAVGATDAAQGHEEHTGPTELQEAWEERTAIMVYDGHLPPSAAADLAWAALAPYGTKP